MSTLKLRARYQILFGGLLQGIYHDLGDQLNYSKVMTKGVLTKSVRASCIKDLYHTETGRDTGEPQFSALEASIVSSHGSCLFCFSVQTTLSSLHAGKLRSLIPDFTHQFDAQILSGGICSCVVGDHFNLMFVSCAIMMMKD